MEDSRNDGTAKEDTDLTPKPRIALAGRPRPKHHPRGHSLIFLIVMSSKLHQREPHWETESMRWILTHEVTAALLDKTLKGINSHGLDKTYLIVKRHRSAHLSLKIPDTPSTLQRRTK